MDEVDDMDAVDNKHALSTASTSSTESIAFRTNKKRPTRGAFPGDQPVYEGSYFICLDSATCRKVAPDPAFYALHPHGLYN